MMFNNLLNQAFRVIPQQNFTYLKFKSESVNDIGIKQNEYYAGVEYNGSVQAVDSKMYQELGLDFSKKYINIYSSLKIQNVTNEQETPDKIIWNNKEYFVVSCSDWYVQDGWTNILAVENNIEEENEEEDEEDEEGGEEIVDSQSNL